MKLGQRALRRSRIRREIAHLLCPVDEPPYASATADLVKTSYVNATGALINGRYASPQSPIGLGIVKELKIGNQHLDPTASLIQIIQ
jgi:predicted transcriptional regulator with HTH domain